MIVGILAAVALPNYKAAILGAREATLTQDLFLFRDLIDQFYADKGRYPVVPRRAQGAGLPAQDPDRSHHRGRRTGRSSTPRPIPDDPTAQPGIYDVKSASAATSQKGTPYNEW